MSALANLYPGHLVVDRIAIVVATVAIVSATGWIASLFFERRPAVRHWVLLSALLAALASPLLACAFVASETSFLDLRLLTFVEPSVVAPPVSGERSADHAPSLPQGERLLPAADSGPEVAAVGASPAVSDRFRSAVVAGLALWLSGSVLSLIGLARSSLFLGRLGRTLRPMPDAADALDEIRRMLGARALPAVMVSELARTPMAAGWLRPVIVLPADLAGAVSRVQLRDVLTHEFAHIQRRDNLILVLQAIARSAFWPVPFVHLLNRELDRAREEICDNYVLARRDAVSYGETLLRLAQLSYGVAMPMGTVGILHWRGKLEARIVGLLRKGRSTVTRTRPTVAAAVLVLFLVASGLLCATTIIAARDAGKKKAQVNVPTVPLITVVEIPDAEYAPPTAEDQLATAAIPAEAWGEPVNGLRTAIVARTPLIDENQRLCYDIVAENVGDQEVRFAAEVGLPVYSFCNAELVDADGKRVDLRRGVMLRFHIPHRLIRFRLKPGERTTIAPWSTQLVWLDEAGQPIASPKRNLAYEFFSVRPGHFSLSARVELGPGIYSTDPTTKSRKVLSPAKGEWSGTLHTGAVGVALFAAADAEPEKPAENPATGPTTDPKE